jgi:FkbM family methyltransferase
MRVSQFRTFSQYSYLERVVLLATLVLRRLLVRLLFYLESEHVFRLAAERALLARRCGPANSIEMIDHDIGRVRLTLRRHTSDFTVFSHCLIDQHYRPVVGLMQNCLTDTPVRMIIDAGANIGASAVYLGRMFPDATVLALEADRDNCKLCEANVTSSGLNNVTVLHRALWTDGGVLDVANDFRDGRAWALRVGPQTRRSAAHSLVNGIDMITIIESCAPCGIDLLKLDIEGAEERIFRSADVVATWLPHIRVIAVEIHERRGYDLILPQLRQHGFFVFQRNELTIGIRQDQTTPGLLLDYFRGEPIVREAPLIA